MNARTRKIHDGIRELVVTRGAVADWRRVRALRMALTVVLGVAVAAYGMVAVVDATRSVSGARAQDVPSSLEDDRADAAPTDAPPSEALRDDLFTAAGARPVIEREKPRTNPAELLALIELQGVIGGARPRAMVHFRQSQETVTVSVGDDLGEFEVIELRERSVVLRWRDELFELSL